MTKNEKLLNGFSIEFEIENTAKNKAILYQMNPRNICRSALPMGF